MILSFKTAGVDTMFHNSAESMCLIDCGEIDRNSVTSRSCEALLLIVYILLFSGLKPTSGPNAGSRMFLSTIYLG